MKAAVLNRCHRTPEYCRGILQMVLLGKQLRVAQSKAAGILGLSRDPAPLKVGIPREMALCSRNCPVSGLWEERGWELELSGEETEGRHLTLYFTWSYNHT